MCNTDEKKEVPMQPKQEESNDKLRKQAYHKPRLRVIELVTEEVLAGGCKLTDGGSNFGSPIGCIGPGGACSQLQS